MFLLGHFINKDWNLRKVVLAFRLVPAPHSGIAISDTFLQCLDDWNITSKVSVL